MKVQIEQLKKKKKSLKDFNKQNIKPTDDEIGTRSLTTIKTGMGSGVVNDYRGDVPSGLQGARP